MNAWTKATLKPVFLPGTVIVGVAALLIQYSWIPLSPSGLVFFYYAVFAAAVLLALRFRSLRIVFSALVLLLGHYALIAKGPHLSSGVGRSAFEAVALLIPLDFALLTLLPERTMERSHLFAMAAVVFFETTFVLVFSRPDQPQIGLLHFSLVHPYHLRLPQPAILMFAAAFAVLLTRLIRFRRSIDHGMLWSLAAACIGMEAGAISRAGTSYFAISGLILASSVVENSYSLAYRDELTGLHSRRAFNDALLRLRAPYAIAAVDIDHFKSINDTYGHDTGDQVLRLVASRLAAVSGGGQPYRVGGEEFTILFAARTAKDVFDHLELLRMNIESCSFRIRKGEDRRKTPRETDRRAPAVRKAKGVSRPLSSGLSVTVSIGIAESRAGMNVDQIIAEADKALYAAKQGGRNRIEIASGESKPKRKARAAKPKS